MSETPSSYFGRMFFDVDEGLNFYINCMNAIIMTSATDNRLIIYDSPPELEMLATRKVAVHLIAIELKNLWKVYESNGYSIRDDTFWNAVEIINENWDSSGWDIDWSQFPKIISDKIRHEMLEIPNKFRDWFKDHYDILVNTTPSFIFELLPELVWRFNGQVDYLQTALKLILGTKLSDRGKFKLMCMCCMEGDIGEFYESQDWVNSCKVDEGLMANKHVRYWHCYFTGVEPTLPKGLENVYASYKNYLLKSPEFLNSSTLDYYFNFYCKTSLQKLVFCIFGMCEFDSFTLKHLLMRLFGEEQATLFESHVLDIMQIFLRDFCFHFALQLWYHVKDSMSGDQFIGMMRTLILRVDQDKWKLPHSVYRTPQFWHFAQDLWKSAPEHLKMYFYQHQSGGLIFNWNRWFDLGCCVTGSPDYLRDDNLLLAIVSDAEMEFRSEFWKHEWSDLMIGSRPELLRKFMFTCLRDLQEIREYQRLIIDSSAMNDYLKRIFAHFDFDELNLFLDMAPDPIQRKLWKAQMIGQPFYAFPSKSKLNNLIEFFQDVDEENKIKFWSLWIDKWNAKFLEEDLLEYKASIRDKIVEFIEALCDDFKRPALEKIESFLHSLQLKLEFEQKAMEGGTYVKERQNVWHRLFFKKQK